MLYPWYQRPLLLLFLVVYRLAAWIAGTRRGLPEGSRDEYSTAAIVHIPCLRCGTPSAQQFNICALGERFYGVCTRCDIGINRAVLCYIRYPQRRMIMRAYTRRALHNETRTPCHS